MSKSSKNGNVQRNCRKRKICSCDPENDDALFNNNNKKRHINDDDHKISFAQDIIIKKEIQPFLLFTHNNSNMNHHVTIPTFITCSEPLRDFKFSINSARYADQLKKQCEQLLNKQNDDAIQYYNNNIVNQLIFPPLNEIYPKWLCGEYCNHGSDYIEKKHWIESGFNKYINLCTVSKDNFHPKIVTLKRYLTIQNRKKINYCLNLFPPTFRHKINFDPTCPTYGIQVSGKTFGTRHNASINSFYYGITDWNSKIKNNIEQQVIINEYKVPNMSQISPVSIIQKITHNGLTISDRNYVYLFGYHLDASLNIESVNSFSSANFLIQFRLKSPNTKEGSCSWEFRVIVDSDYFYQTQHYVKLTLGFICSSIYHHESLKYITFSLHCWQTFFESDFKECDNNNIKSITYNYINSTNSEILQMKHKATAVKYDYFIYIDQFEYSETRFQKYLNEKNITDDDLLNQNIYHHKNRKLDNGEDDYFIQFPIDAFIWIIILSNIANQNKKLISQCANKKVQAYLHMINNHGVSNYNASSNRIKNFDLATYIWGTGEVQKKDFLKGIRLLKQGIVTEDNLNLYYLSEINNLEQLENETNFTMLASNLYHGPSGSFIENHEEDYKFEGIIWTKPSGENCRLTIGAQRRALGSNALFTVFSKPGSYIGFVANGLCMTIAGHGVRRAHLSWIDYDWRICDLFRFIQKSILKRAQKHVSQCPSISSSKTSKHKKKLCKCLKNQMFTRYNDLPTVESISFEICKKI